MTDTAPDTGTEATTTSEHPVGSPRNPLPSTEVTEAGATPTLGDLQAEVEKWKTQSRKHEDRAKANAGATKELDEFRKASMTEQERAVAEAKAAGRQEALTEAGSRLAAAEVRVAAAGRLDPDQLATLLENVNLTGFLTDTGEVDASKVTTFVDGIAPKPADGPTVVDLGQGARGVPALNGDPLLDSIKAAAGIR